MAGQEGIEPPTPGFGDRCSAKLSYWPIYIFNVLLNLAVQGMLALKPAILLQFKPLRTRPFILFRCVITPLTIGTRERYDFSRHCFTGFRILSGLSIFYR